MCVFIASNTLHRMNERHTLVDLRISAVDLLVLDHPEQQTLPPFLPGIPANLCRPSAPLPRRKRRRPDGGGRVALPLCLDVGRLGRGGPCPPCHAAFDSLVQETMGRLKASGSSNDPVPPLVKELFLAVGPYLHASLTAVCGSCKFQARICAATD